MVEIYIDEKGTTAGLYDVIQWWLEHYEGMEHLTLGGSTSPETWYTVSVILRRCLEKINDSKLVKKTGEKP